VSASVLDDVVRRIDQAFNGLNQLQGKAGHTLMSNEWLMSIRSRISIPGGTCEFDLPAYYAWQQLGPARRRADLLHWIATLTPLAQAISVLMGLLRDAGMPQKAVAPGGQYQQSLPPNKAYLLLRLRLDSAELIPEISGHRLMVSVRFMRAETDGRLRPVTSDCNFELTLCT
jgi:cell division protein ZapD